MEKLKINEIVKIVNSNNEELNGLEFKVIDITNDKGKDIFSLSSQNNSKHIIKICEPDLK